MKLIHRNINSKNRNAIVFVHGLDGSNDSWQDKSVGFLIWKKKIKGFSTFLKEDETISKHYDFFSFDYHARILGFFNKLLSWTHLLFPLTNKYHPFNTSINSYSSSLYSCLTDLVDNQNYRSIVIIAHSMGGLVSKSAILDFINYNPSVIKLFISLAVPHNGSNIANIFRILRHKIVKELSSPSGTIIKLNNEWERISEIDESPLPKTIYFHCEYDRLVQKSSAHPNSDKRRPPYSNKHTVQEDHSSIRYPSLDKQIVINYSITEMKNIIYNETLNNEIDIPNIISNDSYQVIDLFNRLLSLSTEKERSNIINLYSRYLFLKKRNSDHSTEIITKLSNLTFYESSDTEISNEILILSRILNQPVTT